MPGLSLYAQKLLGDQLLTLSRWMSLHTADPTDAGLMGDEVPLIGTNYGRLYILGKMSPFDLATGVSTLMVDISIGPAAIPWGLLTHAGFWEEETGGNMIMSGPLSTAQDTPAGKEFRLLAGQFQIRVE